MTWMNAGLTAALLFSAPAFADDAQQTTTTTMRAAMAEQASMPAARRAQGGEASTDARPKAERPKTMERSPGVQHGGAADQAAKLAHQHAMASETSQAESMHAAMANRAAMNAMSRSMMGGASGTCETGSDCQNAAGMTRMMGSGGGMTGGSASGGSGNMTSGTRGSTAGGTSMPMGGKR